MMTSPRLQDRTNLYLANQECVAATPTGVYNLVLQKAIYIYDDCITEFSQAPDLEGSIPPELGPF